MCFSVATWTVRWQRGPEVLTVHLQKAYATDTCFVLSSPRLDKEAEATRFQCYSWDSQHEPEYGTCQDGQQDMFYTSEREHRTQRCALCTGVGWQSKPWQDCWALCIGGAGHPTDGLNPGRTVGLSAGVVGQFVSKSYSLNSFSFNFNPAVCSLIPFKIRMYMLRLCPFKLEVVLVTPIHTAANICCR